MRLADGRRLEEWDCQSRHYFAASQVVYGRTCASFLAAEPVAVGQAVSVNQDGRLVPSPPGARVLGVVRQNYGDGLAVVDLW